MAVREFCQQNGQASLEEVKGRRKLWVTLPTQNGAQTSSMDELKMDLSTLNQGASCKSPHTTTSAMYKLKL
eukprot:1152560-Pelagomonas_calceolata.AAC.7